VHSARLWVVVGVAAAGALAPARAEAQLHFDVGAEGGVSKRVLTDRPPGGPDAGFGAAFEVHGHIAILPLLRAGLYVAHEVAPVPGLAAREITSAGVRFKVVPPLLRGPWRTWLFAGFGYAGVYAPGYATVYPVAAGGAPLAVNVAGSGGSYFEVPVGLGASYRLRKWVELTGELGARIGFGFHGSVYGEDGGRAAFAANGSGLQERIREAGNDALGLALMLGVSFDR
jgi:hypothetical protein